MPLALVIANEPALSLGGIKLAREIIIISVFNRNPNIHRSVMTKIKIVKYL